eukprot:PhM_4_TR13342/c0_g1_i1/m.69185
MLRIRAVSRLAPTLANQQRGIQTQGAEKSTKDQGRHTDGADSTTGEQMTSVEPPPGIRELVDFHFGSSEHVRVPKRPEDDRKLTDLERERKMLEKYGPLGPGERPTMTPSQSRRDELQKVQDIDGLPWEVRWKKNLIPTAEELVQEMRDRMELSELDPMEREVQWYLHWKDRLFKAQRDRMIWPQGYTDYLDHYDESGRRRSLPGTQKWTDQNWKHLADEHSRDRMWLASSEERQLRLEATRSSHDDLVAQREEKDMEVADLYHGLALGVIDPDPDQATRVLAGTSDPVELKRAQRKLRLHSAEMFVQTTVGEVLVDKETGSPVTSVSHEKLPSGLTIAEASVIELQGAGLQDQMDNKAEQALSQGQSGVLEYLRQQRAEGKKHGDKPALVSLAETERDRVLELKRKAGFIEIESRPESVKDTEAPELHYHPKDEILDGEVPEWYTKLIIEPGPSITTYGTTNDPIESREMTKEELEKYYHKDVTDKDMVLETDEISAGENAFDELKFHRQRTTPELVKGFKPLPKYSDLPAVQKMGEDGTLTASQRLAKKRRERRKTNLNWEHDLSLPDLPWDTDPVMDPYRGVSEDGAVAFHKPTLTEVFDTYKKYLLKVLCEFHNITAYGSEQRGEEKLFEAIKNVQEGNVGPHPPAAEEHLEVIRLSYESHLRQFLHDWYNHRGAGRKHDAEAQKATAEQLAHRAAAKCKLLGKAFMEFMQERTANELDAVKKSPNMKHKVIVKEKAHETLVKPYEKWLAGLADIVRSKYSNWEQIEVQREFMLRTLNEARNKCPAKVENTSAQMRGLIVEAFFLWCKGTLQFHCAKKSLEFFHLHNDTRFRSRAEELFEESFELYQAFQKYAEQCGVYIPIPNADAPIEYDDTEFLEGENAHVAELSGQLEKAERLWKGSTRYRWFPMWDETDFMHFLERRGRISMAMDVSDRTLEAMNRKTHPSIHPFPEVGRRELEGAPLTQETTEHLWLRHMADLYMEHSQFNEKVGRHGTAAEHFKHAIGLFRLAMKQARERLPPSWTAPIYTKAKYLMYTAAYSSDRDQTIQEVEDCIAQIRALPELPRNWVVRTLDLHIRAAMFAKVIPLYVHRIRERAERDVKTSFSSEQLIANMQHRERVGGDLSSMMAFEEAADRQAQQFRDVCFAHRDQEKEGSDHWHMFNHFAFTVRVRPKNPEEVDKLKEVYWQTYDYLYSATALGTRTRAIYFQESIRRISMILAPGTIKHREELLEELKKVQTAMKHMIEQEDMKRAIASLENNIKTNGPTQQIYIYGTADIHAAALKHQQQQKSMSQLLDSSASQDYDEIRQRFVTSREIGGGEQPDVAAIAQNKKDGGDRPAGTTDDEMSMKDRIKMSEQK